MSLVAPFPYFGGKRAVAAEVWRRFGDVNHYIEPFFGSGAVLLGRPHWPFAATRVETVNDADGLLANFWRAMTVDPEAVAHHADWPVNEADLHARHLWLVGARERLTERLMADPRAFDAEAAGWWVWGACAWIGSGWCSGNGPWRAVDGLFTKTDDGGRGVLRQRPHLSGAGQGVHRPAGVRAALQPIAERLRGVRVACGDWSRILGRSVLAGGGGSSLDALPRDWSTGVFLDPPYGGGVAAGLYHRECDEAEERIAADVWAWATEHGTNSNLRIAVCDYEDGRNVPPGWVAMPWDANSRKGGAGYGNRSVAGQANARRERIWFSPHCNNEAAQPSLFGDVA